MSTLKNWLTITTGLVMALTFTAGAQQKKPQPPVAKEVKKGDVYVVVQKVPQYPGGQEAMWKFLQKNVTYPAVDREKNQQGKVFVNFVVEPDGRITTVKALRGPSETLKAEAVRVMKLSPNWVPGMQGGKKVRTEFTVPINFVLGAS